MDDLTLARWRLWTQRLSGHTYESAEDVVRGLLGFQAENYSQAAWAIASRTPGTTAAEFDGWFDEGRILRTHVLRPTWHFVLPEDIDWLLAITAPRIRRSLRQLQAALEIPDAIVDEAIGVITEALSPGEHLTREQLGEHLAATGLPGKGMGLGLMLSYAESHAAICSGARRDGRQTYALLATPAPPPPRLERAEALARLALRYVAGHGPATERDLAYWASLTLSDARAGIAAVVDRLDSLDHEGRTYWFVPPRPEDAAPSPRGHLLQILDEYYRGYQDSRHVLDGAGIIPHGRVTSLGMALVDSQMVGSTKLTKASEVRFLITRFRKLDPAEMEALVAAGHRYGGFLGVPAAVAFAADPSRR